MTLLECKALALPFHLGKPKGSHSILRGVGVNPRRFAWFHLVVRHKARRYILPSGRSA